MYAPVPSETQESQRRAGFLSENEHRLATSYTGPHGRMGKDLSSVPGSSQPIEPAASEKLCGRVHAAAAAGCCSRIKLAMAW